MELEQLVKEVGSGIPRLVTRWSDASGEPHVICTKPTSTTSKQSDDHRCLNSFNIDRDSSC